MIDVCHKGRRAASIKTSYLAMAYERVVPSIAQMPLIPYATVEVR